jgi:hypothetical protein
MISYLSSFKHEIYFVISVGCGTLDLLDLPIQNDAKIEIKD